MYGKIDNHRYEVVVWRIVTKNYIPHCALQIVCGVGDDNESYDIFVHLTREGLKLDTFYSLAHSDRYLSMSATFKTVLTVEKTNKLKKIISRLNALNDQHIDTTIKANLFFSCEDFVYYFTNCGSEHFCIHSIIPLLFAPT